MAKVSARNVTLRLDDSVVRQAKRMALEQDKSLSQWVAQMIRNTVGADERFVCTRRQALRRLEQGLHLGGRALTRDEIYDR